MRIHPATLTGDGEVALAIYTSSRSAWLSRPLRSWERCPEVILACLIGFGLRRGRTTWKLVCVSILFRIVIGMQVVVQADRQTWGATLAVQLVHLALGPSQSRYTVRELSCHRHCRHTIWEFDDFSETNRGAHYRFENRALLSVFQVSSLPRITYPRAGSRRGTSPTVSLIRADESASGYRIRCTPDDSVPRQSMILRGAG